MNAPLAPQDRLLARLLQVAVGEGASALQCIRAQHAHQVLSLEVEGPTLALPLLGLKRVRTAGDCFDVSPGEIFIVTGPCTIDVEHRLDAAAHRYLTVGLPLTPAVLSAARQLWGEPLRAAAPLATRASAAPLADLLLRWSDAVEQHREREAALAVTGVLLRLAEQGHAGLLQPVAPTLAARVRAMVAERPGHAWSSGDVEAELGLSGPTLRRRLADEGVGLRHLIVQARLARGMELLYTTTLPVKSVAQRVGYQSASSFAKRFAERYGMEPSRIANG